MKITSILGLAAAIAFASASTVFAAGETATTKAECEALNMTWDEAQQKCVKE